MASYLETVYFRNEYGQNDYPQLLCGHIAKTYFWTGESAAGKKILDIGSGKGNHLMGFNRCGLTPCGLDKRKECLDVLKDFDIRECDIEKDPFPYPDGYFDGVFSKSVLEHVTNTDNFFRQSLRVLRPGGVAVFMTPDWRSQHEFFWDDYTHVKAFTRKSLQNAMLINGFEDVRCDYFLQLPFVWKYPQLNLLTRLIALLPDSLKWRDREESDFRRLIRFSKEKMLLAVGRKPHE